MHKRDGDGRVVKKLGLAVAASLTLIALGCTALVWRARPVVQACGSGPTALADPAAMLWYNRPAAVRHDGRLYVGYVAGRTPFGDTEDIRRLPWVGWRINRALVGAGSYRVDVTSFDGKGADPATTTLRRWPSPDDHGAPALLSTPKGLVAAYSHHASPLYVRSGGPEWGPERMIDGGAATYPRLLALPDRVVLIYARSKSHPAGGRDLVFRTSDDGGGRWSAASTLVAAAPGEYVYGTQAVADGSGFCLAYSIYGPVGRSEGTRTRLALACSDGDGDGGVERRSILPGGAHQDLLPFDVTMHQGQPRVAFAVCQARFDPDRLWNDCPAYVATLRSGRWERLALGTMASARMPGGMSFDPRDSDRLAWVQRHRGDSSRIAIVRLGPSPRLERAIATNDFPTMPLFVDFPGISLLWSETGRFRTPEHHHMRLMGACRPTDAG